jgi:carbon storage regulator
MSNGNLVLTRRPGASILIGDDITIRVVRVVGQQVHLSISAPKELRVDRNEVRERILAEQRAAL